MADETKVEENESAGDAAKRRSTGYHMGTVDSVISVEDVNRQAKAMATDVPLEKVASLANNAPFVNLKDLRCGYGKMEIIHNLNLQVGKGQSLCLIGPNGAGKSTVLHAIYGLNTVMGGQILVGDGDQAKDVSKLTANQKLKRAGIAYILQDKSIFPDMTVEENLWMGGFLMETPVQAKEAAEKVFAKYDRLAQRRKHLAKVLSGGERRLLEISRALVMNPEVLLVDEPSIGLEPRFIDMVFEILDDLQHAEGKTIIMVEQNAKKGLEFADIGYVLVSGELAIAGSGDALLENEDVGRLFLGG
ncbi:MAG: ABC transporter ATP-binding protein [Rhodospirillales bacterium]